MAYSQEPTKDEQPVPQEILDMLVFADPDMPEGQAVIFPLRSVEDSDAWAHDEGPVSWR
jgi:hypothetical protein